MSGLVGLCYECSEGNAGAGSGSSSVTLSACVRLQMICVWVSQGTERRDEGLFWIYVGSMKTLYPPRRPILPHNLTVTLTHKDGLGWWVPQGGKGQSLR